MNPRVWVLIMLGAALWTTARQCDGPDLATPRDAAVVPTASNHLAVQAEPGVIEPTAPQAIRALQLEPGVEAEPEFEPAALPEPPPVADTGGVAEPVSDTEGMMSEPPPVADTDGMLVEPPMVTEEPLAEPIEEPAAAPIEDPLAPWRVQGTEGFENRTTDPISDMDGEGGNAIGEMQGDDGNRIDEMDEDRGNRISEMSTDRGNRISEMNEDRGNRISEMNEDRGNRISEMSEDRGNRISEM